MVQNVDCLQSATIVISPTELKGSWTGIECITALTNVTIVDNNLTSGSLRWDDDNFPEQMFRTGKFSEVTFTGKAVLYA